MRRLLLATMLLFHCPHVLAQKPIDFSITLPAQKVKNSLYNKIELMDSRYDTTFFGSVFLGGFMKPVVPVVPMHQQIVNVMKALTDETAKYGELLLQFRKFSFGRYGSVQMSEKGYCYLKATLYAKNEREQYQRVDSIDSLVVVKLKSMTWDGFKSGSEMLTGFISRNLAKVATDTVSYSVLDVIQIDDIEKRRMPLYAAQKYTDGLYLTYKSFAKQEPDKQSLQAEMKEKRTIQFKTQETDGEWEKIKPKDVYAVVYEGKPYIATDVGFYPIRKLGTDLFFTGEFKNQANSGHYMAAGVMYGAIGGAVAGLVGGLLPDNDKITFEVKIDHLTGGFIKIKQVQKQ